ncbi:MAG: hypothetical protein ABL888_17850 [Pirellulaceae bacterium]
MRHVENLIFVIGAAAAGLLLCSTLMFLSGLLIFPTGRDAGGAVVAFIFLGSCGGILGLIVGLVAALRWVAQRSSSDAPWLALVGMPAGLLVGLSIRKTGILSSNYLGDLIEWMPGGIAFLIAMTFAGGFVGTIADDLTTSIRRDSAAKKNADTVNKRAASSFDRKKE